MWNPLSPPSPCLHKTICIRVLNWLYHNTTAKKNVAYEQRPTIPENTKLQLHRKAARQ